MCTNIVRTKPAMLCGSDVAVHSRLRNYGGIAVSPLWVRCGVAVHSRPQSYSRVPLGTCGSPLLSAVVLLCTNGLEVMVVSLWVRCGVAVHSQLRHQSHGRASAV